LEFGESITIASCEPDAPVDSGVRSKGEVDAEESEFGISGIKEGYIKGISRLGWLPRTSKWSSPRGNSQICMLA
jgi:hypothetical protein